MKNRDIARLVKRIKERDQAAFEELYKRMWQSVYYLVFKQVKNPEDATDLTQEIFLKVSKEIHTLRNDAAFYMWLNRIAINYCNRYLSSNRRDVTSIDEVEDSLFEDKKEFLPEEILSDRELCRAMSEIVSELPDEQRQAILLYYYNDFSTKEIADILKTTPNAVNIKLSRARSTIRSKFEALEKKGTVIYSIVTVPVLTRILWAEAETICTLALRDQILYGLQASVSKAASVATAQAAYASGSAADIGSAAAKPLLMKIGAGVLAVAIIGGAAAGGHYLINKKASETEPQTQSIESEPAETPDKPVTYTELEDFIGEQDAAAIRAWGTISIENNNEKLVEIAERHGFTWDNAYAENPSDGIYVLFWLEKQDKRLVMCEYYKAETTEWCVVYSIVEITDVIPQADEIKTFFTDSI